MAHGKPMELDIAAHVGFVQQDPGNLMLRMELGDLYQRVGRWDDAIQYYEFCLAIKPDHMPARSRIAGVLISQCRFAEAAQAYRWMIGQGEDAAALHHNLGLCLHLTGQFSAAASCFADAERRGLLQLSNLAWWTRAIHHGDGAEAALTLCRRWHAAATGPAERAESGSYLTRLLLDLGDGAESARVARDVLQVDPGDAVAHVAVGIASLELQEIDAAQVHFERALVRDPASGRGWQGIGLVHLRRSRLAESEFALAKAKEHAPNDLGTQVSLGWVKLLQRDLPAAQLAFEAALEVDRTFGESHGGLASAFALQGRIEAAEREIKLARRLGPHGFGAEFADAVLLAARGQQEASAEVIMQALRRQVPGSAHATLLEQLERVLADQRGSGRPAHEAGDSPPGRHVGGRDAVEDAA